MQSLSGFFLNYLNVDQVCHEGFSLVKDALRHTCAKRFFEISQIPDKSYIFLGSAKQ